MPVLRASAKMHALDEGNHSAQTWLTMTGSIYYLSLALAYLGRRAADPELRVAVSSQEDEMRVGMANVFVVIDNDSKWHFQTLALRMHQVRSGRVRYGGIRRSSASPRPHCDGTPSSSVWPSPRQTPGPPCPHPSDRRLFGHRPGRRQARHAHGNRFADGADQRFEA